MSKTVKEESEKTDSLCNVRWEKPSKGTKTAALLRYYNKKRSTHSVLSDSSSGLFLLKPGKTPIHSFE